MKRVMNRMQQMKINKLILFFALCFYAASSCYASDSGPFDIAVDQPLLQLAEVKFAEKAPLPSKSTHTHKAKSRSLMPQPKSKVVEQYEIEGYIEQEYIRAVLEVENKQSVIGNIYDYQGNGTYVHGEYLDGALHVYDTAGTHFTIILNE